jgi:hypothetical protein
MAAASHSTGRGTAAMRAGLGDRNRRRKSTGTSDTSLLPSQRIRAIPLCVVFQLTLLRDRMDRRLVVGVIAQPQPGVPALHTVVPRDVQARVGRSDLVDGGHTSILPARDARLMP